MVQKKAKPFNHPDGQHLFLIKILTPQNDLVALFGTRPDQIDPFLSFLEKLCQEKNRKKVNRKKIDPFV